MAKKYKDMASQMKSMQEGMMQEELGEGDVIPKASGSLAKFKAAKKAFKAPAKAFKSQKNKI